MRNQKTGQRLKADLDSLALKTTEEQSNNYQLLDDYVVWFVNWR